MPHAVMLFVLGVLPAAAETLSLAAADWPAPRRAEVLATHKPVSDFLRVVDRDDASVLYLRHAGGDAGSLFAEQLRDALVALGVPGKRILLVPVAAQADHLILEFSAKGETGP